MNTNSIKSIRLDNQVVETEKRSLSFSPDDKNRIARFLSSRRVLCESIANDAKQDTFRMVRLWAFRAAVSVMASKNANENSLITDETVRDLQRKKARFLSSGSLFESDFFRPIEGHSACEVLIQSGVMWLFDLLKVKPETDLRLLGLAGSVVDSVLVVPMIAYIRLDDEGKRKDDSRNGLRVAFLSHYDALKTYLTGVYSSLRRGVQDESGKVTSTEGQQEKAGDAWQPCKEDSKLDDLIGSDLLDNAVSVIDSFIVGACLRSDLENSLRQIAPYVVRGWSNKDIAQAVQLSPSRTSRLVSRLRDMITRRVSSPDCVNALDELHMSLVL